MHNCLADCFLQDKGPVNVQFGTLRAGEKDQGGVSLLGDGMPGLGGKSLSYYMERMAWYFLLFFRL